MNDKAAPEEIHALQERQRLLEGQIEGLYQQLARQAARLLVVHQAGEALQSTQDAEELATSLLGNIAEAVFAAKGCVTRLTKDELRILATQGLDDVEVEELAESESEAAVWFEVADGRTPVRSEELYEESEEAEEEEWDPEASAAAADLEEESEDGSEAVAEATPEADLEADVEFGDEPEGEAESKRGRPLFDIYIPLMVEDEVLGVLALGSRVDGRVFGSEDIQLATTLAAHLAVALQSAQLITEKNEHIEQLSVLLRISKEITSTLEIERVLQTITQMMGLIIPNRRALVAITEGAQLRIRASSGEGFDPKEARSDPLLPALRWAHSARLEVNTTREELREDETIDGRDVLLPILEREGGPASLAILPLNDDEGSLGVLAIESDETEPPLNEDREELATILANQTTVAIRNAELYQRIPMMSVLEPFLSKRKGQGENRRWLRWAVIAAVLAVGFLLPLPAWVSGDASLRPDHPVALRAATEGIIEEVFVEEGKPVEAGAVVARLRQDEFRSQLEQVRALIKQSQAEAASARMQADLASFQAHRAEIDRLDETERFLSNELARTQLTAPISGIVLTPHVERRTGERLARGETFAELANLGSLELEIAVSEKDILRVKPGRKVRLKVHAFPQKTFHGEVIRIAPHASGDRSFRVVVRIDNAEGLLRPGMTGRAHIVTAWRPPLVSFFQPVFRAFRLKWWI